MPPAQAGGTLQLLAEALVTRSEGEVGETGDGGTQQLHEQEYSGRVTVVATPFVREELPYEYGTPRCGSGE